MGVRLLIISAVILQSSILIAILQSPILNVSRFDYLRLVEQWPASTCNNLENNTCSRPLPNTFTIHGLWPEIFNGSTPINCTNTPFDLSKIKALEPQLNQHWPNLIAPTKNSAFWKHEWSNHGTCSESTFDLLAYFSLTLNLKGRLNLHKVLQDANITSGKTYPKLDIFNAIKKEINAEPHLRCNSPFNQKAISQLWEVGVCYDKKGTKNINCRTRWTPACKEDILFPVS